jgi:hypothetical protein
MPLSNPPDFYRHMKLIAQTQVEQAKALIRMASALEELIQILKEEREEAQDEAR